MLDLDHIITIVSKEWITYSAGVFFNMGFFMWLAHFVSRSASTHGGKIFWVAFAVLLLKDVLISNVILFDVMLYVSIAVLFTHRAIIFSPISGFIKKLKQRSYNKYKNCQIEKDNVAYELNQLKYKNQLAIDENKKIKNEEKFLNNLSKKLDSF